MATIKSFEQFINESNRAIDLKAKAIFHQHIDEIVDDAEFEEFDYSDDYSKEGNFYSEFDGWKFLWTGTESGGRYYNNFDDGIQYTSPNNEEGSFVLD